MHSLRTGLSALLALAGLALARPAQADLPPPDGQKFVGYAFQIEGAAALTDHVIVAYPCTGSNGVPVDGYARVGAEPVEVGRRGGWCTLYAVKKAAFEAFEKSRKAGEPTVGRDPALEAFFQGPDAKECDVKLSMQSVLPKSDPRDRVVETLRVAKVADGVCDLEPAGTNAGASPAATAAPSASSPTAAASDAPASTAPSSSAGPAGPAGGCAGCAVVDDESDGSWLGGVVTALAIAGGLAARRRPGGRA